MKSLKYFQTIITTVLFITLGGLGGYYFGLQGYEINLKKGTRHIEVINKNDQIASTVDFTRFWEVWKLMNDKHITRPLDPTVLLDGAIEGMVASVGDPYSSYLNTSRNKAVQNSLNGQYEGIGAQLGFDDNDRLIIIAPLDGSPAEGAGVRAGDNILEIEGENTVGLSIAEAVNKIRGKAGTISTLTLARKGFDEPITVRITRATITVDSVTWEDKGSGVAYIRLSRFGESTNKEWASVVNEITAQMPVLYGIVLDVRNNPGGFLESAVYVGSEFINKGVIVKEDFSGGTSYDFTVDHKGRLLNKDIKVAVLINQGSASASEIVAGALKEKRDAILVGQRSFGKGTVQKAEEFGDGASLHVTVAKWITPDGNWIDKQNAKLKDSKYNELDKDGKEIIGGLKPDITVEITDEDINNKRDSQLEKAIEKLTE